MKRRILRFPLSIALGLAAGALLMLCLGKNPLTGYLDLLKGALMSRRRLGDTLSLGAVLMLTGASFALPARAQLFNIGASGQMLMGALCASIWAVASPLPHPLTVAGILIFGAIGGAFWGLLPGLMKAFFRVHEAVSTIMLNWIAFWIVDATIKEGFARGPGIRTLSPLLPPERSLRVSWLAQLLDNDATALGLLVAPICLAGMAFALKRTTFGYELDTMGASRPAAVYAGMPIRRVTATVFAAAGALAGLAGVAYHCGYALDMQAGLMPEQGFDGIAVALVGGNTPLGIGLAGLLFGVLRAGKNYMASSSGIQPELADVLVALILWFAAAPALGDILPRLRKRQDECSQSLRHVLSRKKRRETEGEP